MIWWPQDIYPLALLGIDHRYGGRIELGKNGYRNHRKATWHEMQCTPKVSGLKSYRKAEERSR